MSDRTSAEIFGALFTMLAEMKSADTSGELRNQARTLNDVASWAWHQKYHYDFSACQMGCDEALAELGFARLGADPDDGYQRYLYMGEDY